MAGGEWVDRMHAWVLAMELSDGRRNFALGFVVALAVLVAARWLLCRRSPRPSKHPRVAGADGGIRVPPELVKLLPTSSADVTSTMV